MTNPRPRFKVQTHAEEETRELARLCGVVATTPLIIGLDGELGAGKTQFAKGIMRGIDPAYETWVSSPTYALCNVYPSSPAVQHVDAYRLNSVDDLESIGFWEFVEEGLTVVEWASRVPELLEECDVQIVVSGGTESANRLLNVIALTDDGATLVNAWSGRLTADGWNFE